MKRRAALFRPASIALLLCAVVWSVRADGQQALEYEVKAAYLYDIIDFVTWPPDAFANEGDPIRVCVVGMDPFGPVLDRTMNGVAPGRHRIVIERVRDESAIATCSLIFVPRASAARTEPIIRSTASLPIVSIGETADFLKKGGMIAFVVDGGRVRFDVNASAATARGIVLSSRLLRVARTVVGEDGRP